MSIVNFGLSWAGLLVTYLLSLAFLGIGNISMKKWRNTLGLSVCLVLSLYLLHLDGSTQWLFLMFGCALILFCSARLDFLFCLIGSLLGFGTRLIGRMIFAYPLFSVLGIIDLSPAFPEVWIPFNLAEWLVPGCTFIFLRRKRHMMIRKGPIETD